MNSPKTDVIAYFAVAVIVVSLASIGMELTGFAFADDTAIVNVTISSTAAINFTVSSINFGTGTVTSGTIGALLDSENGRTNSTTFTQVAEGFVLENIGNVNLSNLTIRSDKNADDFIGGDSPTFKYKISDYSGNGGNVGACENNAAASYTEFTTANTTICTGFPPNSSFDEIEIDVQLFIPSNAEGTKGAVVTVAGEY